MQNKIPAAAPARYFTEGDDGRGWEYMVITCQPRQSLAEARRQVIDHAEYGHWELRRSVIYSGGIRKYWLRRRRIRVQRTF